MRELYQADGPKFQGSDSVVEAQLQKLCLKAAEAYSIQLNNQEKEQSKFSL